MFCFGQNCGINLMKKNRARARKKFPGEEIIYYYSTKENLFWRYWPNGHTMDLIIIVSVNVECGFMYV